MTQIATFNGTAGRQKIRISKATMGLQIRRTGPLSVTKNGLALGFPELVAAEITHPSRKRADGGDQLPLGMIALWGQYLRGPIAERQNGDQYTAEVNYWLNQSSAIEVTSEDQFVVTIDPVAGHTYEVYAPESPVLYPGASSFYNYEVQRMASDLRTKTLYTADAVGLIIPNNPGYIERLTLTLNLPGGGQDDIEVEMRELLSQAQRANPFVSVLNNALASTVAFTEDANFILLSLNMVASVELHNVLGAEYDYMLVRVVDRNTLG